MSAEPLDTHDGVVHFWCPMLGQTLNFSYCRRCQSDLPCSLGAHLLSKPLRRTGFYRGPLQPR